MKKVVCPNERIKIEKKRENLEAPREFQFTYNRCNKRKRCKHTKLH